MLRSIRWTLQLWYAAILAMAVIGIGLTDYFTIQQARYKEIDANLTAAAEVLVAKLRGPARPPHDHGGPGGFDGQGLQSGPGGGEQGGGLGGAPGGGPGGAPGGGPGGGPGGAPGGGPGGQQGGRDGRQLPPDPFDNGPPDGFGGGDGMPPDMRGHDFNRPDRLPRDLELPSGFLQQYGGNDQDDARSFLIVGPDKQVIMSWGVSYDPALLPAATDRPADDDVRLRTRGDNHEALMAAPAHSIVLVSGSIKRIENELHQLLWRWIMAASGVLVLGLTGGWLISNFAVRPIGLMSSTAGSISATRWSGRIDARKVPTELRQLAFVLNATFDRLEAAFMQQARFTADASHELRTPLAVILTHTELALSRDRSPAEYRKTIDTCLAASTRMKSLVESLLLLSHADVGELALQPAPMDLVDVVRENVNMLATVAGKRGITFATQLQKATFVGDPARISQVVANLISNAIRYNREAGSISVTTEVILGDAVLTVADTGTGIAAEDQQHIFDRFFRTDKARSREAGGSGLGLAIVKSIVEAHEGNIQVTSELGVGTTFVVRFPRGSFDTEAYVKPARLEV